MAAAASVYQLRVVVAGISPLIWRRLLVGAEATIAELHAVLQLAFGWGGHHLHDRAAKSVRHPTPAQSPLVALPVPDCADSNLPTAGGAAT